MTETDTPCVLVEGPGYGDAGFFAGWLHAANEANEALQRTECSMKVACPTSTEF